ncbi:MAG TPA: hypothetical protein VEP28_15500, partial [Rubrobacter sp.]|nr:hypothetical protein [Rubrobacter sp.]
MARRAEVQARMEEARAKLAEEGLWVEETCTGCGAPFWTIAERGFLGFRERECPSCHRHMVSPLPWGYRITYWLVFGFFAVFFIQDLREEINLLHKGAFYGFLLMVALMWAISRDLKAVYRHWSSGRGSNNRKPGVDLGRGEGQPVWSEEGAPSLVSRWWVGFVTLLA